jgi:hypothetical protein
LRVRRRASLLSQKHSQVGLVGGELSPSLLELPHAVGAIAPAAPRLVRAHRDDGVDRPFPVILRAGAVLDSDRANLELAVLVLEDDAVVLVSLGGE